MSLSDTGGSQQSRVTPAEEKRRETRYPSDERAIVTLLQSKTVLEAQTLDVSRSGMRIRLAAPLEAGDELRVKIGNTEAFGRVRWCLSLHRPYFDAGIQISVWV